MRTLYQKFLALGVEKYPDESDRRRVHLFNFLSFCSLWLVFPVVIVVSFIQNSSEEFYSTLVVLFAVLVSLYLNYKGYNQAATIGVTLIILGAIWFVLISGPYQTGAPYGNLLIALVSVLLIKKRKVRIFFLILSLSSFIAANYIQLKYKTFSEAEYGPIALILFLIFLGIMHYERLMVSYQNKIRKQSHELLKLKEEKHLREIDLKQKDLENVLITTSTSQQLLKNISKRIQQILRTKNVENDLRGLLLELSQQTAVEEKLKLIRGNIQEVNAEFYDRLLSRFPDLTKMERELAAHLRLNLSNKEIATIKQSTENSVNVAKARLKKKMGFSNNKKLKDFLIGF